MSSSNSLFHALPPVLQSKIDDAFTTTARKYQCTGGFAVDDPISPAGGGFDPMPSTSSGVGRGGFLIPEPAGGGFLIEEGTPPKPPPAPSQILLSLIPAALQFLDLPPDDPEVLGVFQNAAGGWRSAKVHPFGPEKADEEGEGKWVSRDDWHAVCAVLLEGRDEKDNEDGVEADSDVDMSDGFTEPDTHSPPDISSTEASDDDYQLSSTRTRRKPARRTHGTAAAASSSPAPTNIATRTKLTPLQRKTALEAFALFFPDMSDTTSLAAQHIRVGEIQRAARVLKEKIKAEEMVEMLSMFSTAPDKSMGLEDFTRMMIAAKLA